MLYPQRTSSLILKLIKHEYDKENLNNLSLAKNFSTEPEEEYKSSSGVSLTAFSCGDANKKMLIASGVDQKKPFIHFIKLICAIVM